MPVNVSMAACISVPFRCYIHSDPAPPHREVHHRHNNASSTHLSHHHDVRTPWGIIRLLQPIYTVIQMYPCIHGVLSPKGRMTNDHFPSNSSLLIETVAGSLGGEHFEKDFCMFIQSNVDSHRKLVQTCLGPPRFNNRPNIDKKTLKTKNAFFIPSRFNPDTLLCIGLTQT